ncbi:MAG TPA: hypothetical protein VJU84_06560 [Pyrinomonadaceae bacterium]|nr:hypothetical protein [Pyrinomonadaceae bacterium]
MSVVEKASQKWSYCERLGIIGTFVNHFDHFQAFKIAPTDPLQYSPGVPFRETRETSGLHFDSHMTNFT